MQIIAQNVIQTEAGDMAATAAEEEQTEETQIQGVAEAPEEVGTVTIQAPLQFPVVPAQHPKKVRLHADPVIQTIGNQSYIIIPVDGKQGSDQVQVQQIPIDDVQDIVYNA